MAHVIDQVAKNILLPGELIADKWKIAEKIGEGTFSQIYSAYSLDSGKRVAIKVEAPSSLKPVLEWESIILKSLQDCPNVCRYYYHGKHGASTVLVMELLGDSMSMLRLAPDSVHGIPMTTCINVGLEMLDCIEAFHRHGYVHRDIKASNFALNATSNPAKKRYYIIDFGLSRQFMQEGKWLQPREQAEFRGTSMYASLSAHRRMELGPKDDAWSWFFLVIDFIRGELPWALDAQQKNRQHVVSLKEYYVEQHPELLVEGLPGATYLEDIIKHLNSLKYEQLPDYVLIRKLLKRVLYDPQDESTEELVSSSQQHQNEDQEEVNQSENQENISNLEIDETLEDSYWESPFFQEKPHERRHKWVAKAKEFLSKPDTSTIIFQKLLEISKKYKTWFENEDYRDIHERLDSQYIIYKIERKSQEIEITPAMAAAGVGGAVGGVATPPPMIQSFLKRRQSEQKLRTEALKKRRERDLQVRKSIEKKIRQQLLSNLVVGSPANDMKSTVGTPLQHQTEKKVAGEGDGGESAMEMSDEEGVAPSSQPLTVLTAEVASDVPSSAAKAVKALIEKRTQHLTPYPNSSRSPRPPLPPSNYRDSAPVREFENNSPQTVEEAANRSQQRKSGPNGYGSFHDGSDKGAYAERGDGRERGGYRGRGDGRGRGGYGGRGDEVGRGGYGGRGDEGGRGGYGGRGDEVGRGGYGGRGDEGVRGGYGGRGDEGGRGGYGGRGDEGGKGGYGGRGVGRGRGGYGARGDGGGRGGRGWSGPGSHDGYQRSFSKRNEDIKEGASPWQSPRSVGRRGGDHYRTESSGSFRSVSRSRSRSRSKGRSFRNYHSRSHRRNRSYSHSRSRSYSRSRSRSSSSFSQSRGRHDRRNGKYSRSRSRSRSNSRHYHHDRRYSGSGDSPHKYAQR